MSRRTYTADERAQALELYATDGLAAAVSATGIPKGTISSWAERSGVQTSATERTAAAAETNRQLWAERRADLAHRIGAVAEKALDLAEQMLDDQVASKAKDAATTMAILVDKAQLLTGDATERHENRQLRNRLLDEAREHSRSLRSVA